MARPLRPTHHPPTRPCLQVRPETPALDAMVLMEEKNISAVAVVNAAGSIIGNFSISELRCTPACRTPTPARLLAWRPACVGVRVGMICACVPCKEPDLRRPCCIQRWAAMPTSLQAAAADGCVQAGSLTGSRVAHVVYAACPVRPSCRTIMAEHFGSLALPVGEFLALEHGTGAPQTPHPPAATNPTPAFSVA